MHARPAGQVIDDARYNQGQQAGPEQGDVGVVIGAAGQHGDQFRVCLMLGAGDGLGHLALFDFTQ
ncbi:hypothetical protein D3C85_1807970 [compost metagenome]